MEVKQLVGLSLIESTEKMSFARGTRRDGSERRHAARKMVGIHQRKATGIEASKGIVYRRRVEMRSKKRGDRRSGCRNMLRWQKKKNRGPVPNQKLRIAVTNRRGARGLKHGDQTKDELVDPRGPRGAGRADGMSPPVST